MQKALQKITTAEESGALVLATYSGSLKKVVWHYCNKPGHIKRFCRKRIKDGEEKQKLVSKPAVLFAEAF
jgi:hypothetical protein